ncbi:MAG: succinate dehydrogenase cytochrome b subunit [Thermodesulfovibrionales bacterium]|nr:succinate dehydrogenase cytochrome b subunit [Thermodesulfovibrionales bacterium]
MRFVENPVGKKIAMSVTGFLLLAFLFIHLIGNSTIYLGPDGINTYAKGLHSLPPVVWTFRIVMLIIFALHIYFGIKVTLENRQAKPNGYAISKNINSTLSSRTMIWTGLIVLAFVVYHLLHFTLQVTQPHFITSKNLDYLGRPDVFKMIVLSFQRIGITLIYAIGLLSLMLHLTHGIQSLMQTVGLNNERFMPKFRLFGLIIAVFLLVAYLSIPTVVLTGVLKA